MSDQFPPGVAYTLPDDLERQLAMASRISGIDRKVILETILRRHFMEVMPDLPLA